MLQMYVTQYVYLVFIMLKHCNGQSTTCARPPDICPKTKYRSFDGSCNNLKHPIWGMPFTPYGRLLPAKYGNGIDSYTVAEDGSPLPNPRKLSFTLFPSDPYKDPHFTLSAMQYGQVITHDMSLGVLETSPLQCCTPEGQFWDAKRTPPHCDPIVVPANDPDYTQWGVKCIGFTKTTTDRDNNCVGKNQPAQQLSQVNHYLDLSIVYGNNENISNYIRQHVGGKIQVEARNGHTWPIRSTNVSEDCPLAEPNEICYYASDSRVNQNPQLTLLQVMYLREHNRIADALARLNPHWKDEIIFQESRKINIAQHQYISYYEWLQWLLGRKHLVKHKIISETNGFFHDYDENADPSVLNEHANGAFRFHTQIAGKLDLVNENRATIGGVHISDYYFRPQILEQGNFDNLARGLNTQQAMAADRYHDKEITFLLFKANKTSLDLKAIDIERNRNHGLESYNAFRQLCNLTKAENFDGFLREIPEHLVDKLRKFYKNPNDVDLTVGGVLERKLKDALVGPTNHCILLKQFRRTRIADRFWFENKGDTGFTLQQLKEIRKSSISRLLCDNGNNITQMQAHGFLLISAENPLQPCSSLPMVNLTLWKT